MEQAKTVDNHGLSCSVDLFQYGSPIWPSNPDGLCGIKQGMNKQEILDRLRESERALRERGVTHAALFGSRARGEERSDSDIDIMVEVDPDAHIKPFRLRGHRPIYRGAASGACRRGKSRGTETFCPAKLRA
jgi:hypothetical protein